MRNGLVWYVGPEEKEVNTHLNIVHEIRQEEMSDSVFDKINMYNKDTRGNSVYLVFCLLDVAVVSRL